MTLAGRLASCAVASPHRLASEAGRDVLAAGGNAVDAAVATNLVLGVVTPYHCGYGGDLFAIVWDGSLHGYAGAGRAPAAATPDAVRAAAGGDRMPTDGPLTVTVPGVVEGWFALLERFGTRSFAALADPALRLARDGFVVGAYGAAAIARAATRFPHEREWAAVYGAAARGKILRLPALARTIAVLAAEGPSVYYRGEIAAAISDLARARGGLLAPEDLAGHRGEWVAPIATRFRELVVHELPPPAQGVTALEALRIAQGLPPTDPDSPERLHGLVESVKLALADLDTFVTDPAVMTVSPEELLADPRIAKALASIDPRRAGVAARGPTAAGGTAAIVAADEAGMFACLVQSNWRGFGSGLTVPGWGINLHSRGAFFSLDPSHVNVIAPGKRTMHTLIPAMAFRDGRPWLVFGTMGGYGQAQTHLQLLVRMIDEGLGPTDAIDAPRWLFDPQDGTLSVEDRFDPGVIEGLRARGHDVRVVGPYDSVMGHANAIVVGADGFEAASDPRSEGAALGR